MTDQDCVEISKAISKYETMTLGYFRSQYKMDEYPQFLTSIEVRGYGRGYVDGAVFKNAKLAKIKEALEKIVSINRFSHDVRLDIATSSAREALKLLEGE